MHDNDCPHGCDNPDPRCAYCQSADEIYERKGEDVCGQCGRKTAVDDIGQWYADQAAKASKLHEEIRAEQARERPDPATLKRLRWALELAEYVGD